MYFLLCAAAPFDYEDVRQTLVAHLHEDPVHPSERSGRVIPSAFEAVVMRCLSKDPQQRYANAAELAYALEDAAARSSSIRARSGRSPRRRRYPLPAPEREPDRASVRDSRISRGYSRAQSAGRGAPRWEEDGADALETGEEDLTHPQNYRLRVL
jgi:serine/threonine-protein kinase